MRHVRPTQWLVTYTRAAGSGLRLIRHALRLRWDELYHRAFNVVFYVAIGVCLWIDAIYGCPWLVVGIVVSLLGWDVVFCGRVSNFGQASPEFILRRAIETQTLAQYFVAFYGIVLAAILQSSAVLTRTRSMSRVELFAPLLFGVTALVLIPVRISEHRSDRQKRSLTSPSMRAMLCVVMFAQQAAAVTFVHALSMAVRLVRE
jgi:hypothetical protein